MTALIQNKRWLWFISLTMFAYFAGYFIGGRGPVKMVMDSLVVGVAVTISIQWAAAAIPALFDGVSNSGAKTAFGLWLVWAVLLFYFVYVVIFTLAGRPDWIRDLPVAGALSALFFIAGVSAIFAPITTDTTVPKPAMIFTIVAAIIGGVVAGVVLTLGYVTLSANS